MKLVIPNFEFHVKSLVIDFCLCCSLGPWVREHVSKESSTIILQLSACWIRNYCQILLDCPQVPVLVALGMFGLLLRSVMSFPVYSSRLL